MKNRQSKKIHTPNKSFECERPLGWDEIARKLTIAINRYNRKEQRIWKNFSLIRRLFSRPACYRVGVQSVGNPEMMKLHPKTDHHRVWIENTRNKRMRFDLLCVKNSTTNSMFLQDGVKYNRFILMSEDTSARWLSKKITFLHEVFQFIQLEIS